MHQLAFLNVHLLLCSSFGRYLFSMPQLLKPSLWTVSDPYTNIAGAFKLVL